MKITLAKVTGLALLVASFACSGSLVYADTEDTSPALQTLALDANANGSESVAILDCDTEDGMGACPVEGQLAETDPTSSGAVEPAAIAAASTEDSEMPLTQTAATAPSAAEEPAAPIHSVDAIIAEVTQTVTIAVPGDDAGVIEEPAQTGSISEPSATEPVLAAVEKTAPEAAAAPSIEAADAVEVEVIQSVTVTAPGQDVADSDEPTHTGSITEPAATEPVTTLDANSSDDLE